MTATSIQSQHYYIQKSHLDLATKYLSQVINCTLMQDGSLDQFLVRIFTQNEITKLRVSLGSLHEGKKKGSSNFAVWFTGNSYDRQGQFHRLDYQTYAHHHTNNFDAG